MPDRTVSFLSVVAGGCVCAYIALVVVTVTFAAMQTQLALDVRDTESAIGQLETKYYSQVRALAATDPHTMQLSVPSSVTYAVRAEAPSLSLRY